MESKDTVLAAFLFLATAILLFVYFHLKGDSIHVPKPKETSSAAPYQPTCGEVTDECDAVVRLDECDDPDLLKERVKRILTEPLKAGSCAKAEAKLEESCPFGCTLDYASILIVPGKVDFEIEQNEDGCSIEGRKPVRLKASCRPKDEPTLPPP